MWLGDYPTGFTTVVVPFTTHAADGSPVAPSSAFEAADFKLYKDGSATERTSTAGWTIQSPHDTLTGAHVLILDLSDNTDAGFYAAGHVYSVLLDPDETVDSVAVRRWVGQFGIDLSTVRAALPAALVSGRIDASVGAMAANVLTASAINADAITAAKVASDVGTEFAATFLGSTVEGSYTVVQYLRGYAAALMGKVANLETGSPDFRDTGDTVDRISATTDADGNRTAVTLTLS
jgi:hypothetical protein